METQRVTDLACVNTQVAVDTFLSYGLTGRATVTIRWYRLRLSSLIEAGVDLENARFDLLRWYASLPPMSPYTLHGYVRAARRFFHWLFRTGMIYDDPSRILEFPRLPRRGCVGISEPDLRAMLQAAYSHPRDYAILRFVESTGCRLCGLVGLTIPYLDLNRARAIVHEKYDKSRFVFLSDPACQALDRWLLVRRADSGVEHVFINRFGRPIGERSVYDRFGLYARLANVSGPWSPHQWRHRFGRIMAERGMPLGVLSQIMGHETVDITVRHYGMFAVEQLQEMYRRYAP